ncbi:prolipoprotein diacylglyceryl transferase [Hymenobacter aerilatus]|uniref:Prolipoprotein diacylglyceryl transferase n=1 Tax=Hymenobacter aerilatus TaxID=2932251 RepID=A0A8T9STZ5_9BACT|nr:prolipoprotein diacylglyceryl transferase family protein [Hymenobacter aerilatus]UOR03680.1 prolipoprotein diacylglyceryl transferase [Hymenobacter aerilatus]
MPPYPLPAPVLPSPHGHTYYMLFYILAFALGQLLLLWAGYRRGYAWRPWLVLLAASTLAFILGTKLIALPLTDWPAILTGQPWPTDPARSVLGGAVAGTLALLVLRRWLGFSWHVFDVFALPMCLTLAVQGVGCLLTGCCFGELAEAGPAIRYAPDTLPYLWQLHRGQLPADAVASLPVVPTQLYSLLLYVGIGVVLLATRRRVWPGGSRYMLYLGLVLAGRFVLECWRDPAGEQVGSATLVLAGVALKQVQWVLLPMALVALGWWALRARQTDDVAPTPPTVRPLRNLLTVAGLLLLTALLGPGALTSPELLAVKATLFSVVGLEAVCLLRGYQSRVAYLPLALVLLIGMLTSQKAAPDSTRQQYFTFSPAFMQGRYDQDLQDAASSGGCSGGSSPAIRRAYYHRYQVAGGGISYTDVDNPDGNRRLFGAEVLAGTERIGFRELPLNGSFLTSGETDHAQKSLFDLHMFAERDRVLSRSGKLGVGFRFGLHAGNLGYRADDARDVTFKERRMLLAPDLMLWLGRRDILFVQADMGRGVNGLGTIGSTVSLGSGFGQTRGSFAQGGVAFNESGLGITQKTTLFVSGNVRLGGSGLWVEPYAATNFGRTQRLSLRLHYRLPMQGSSR